jgi:hypothetical protein
MGEILTKRMLFGYLLLNINLFILFHGDVAEGEEWQCKKRLG